MAVYQGHACTSRRRIHRRRLRRTHPGPHRTDGIPLHADQRTFNKLLRGLRCLGERGFALLVGRWKMLRHVKISPSRMTDLARAALVLTHFEHNIA
jgi:hypothetical protein